MLDACTVWRGRRSGVRRSCGKGADQVRASHIAPGNEGLGPLAGDWVTAMFGLKDGSVAYFRSVRKAGGRPSRYGMQVFGSESSIWSKGRCRRSSTCPTRAGQPGRSGAAWKNVTSGGIDQPEPLAGPKSRSRHALAVATDRAIEGDGQPACSIYKARGLVEMVMLAVFDSHRRGKPVTFPLVNRKQPLAMLTSCPETKSG